MPNDLVKLFFSDENTAKRRKPGLSPSAAANERDEDESQPENQFF